jgi:hypothetical protein
MGRPLQRFRHSSIHDHSRLKTKTWSERLADNPVLLAAVAQIVFYASKVRGAYAVESLMARAFEPAPTFYCREGGPRYSGQRTLDSEIVESGWMGTARSMTVVGGTDRALLPHIGDKTRLLYREAGRFDSRGVIRLTCGST